MPIEKYLSSTSIQWHKWYTLKCIQRRRSTCTISGHRCVCTYKFIDFGAHWLKDNKDRVLTVFLHAGPTLTGILPYAGLKFYIYEELKRHVPEEHQKSILMRLSCGGLAGLFGQTFTYPLDVVRRQMQVTINFLLFSLLLFICVVLCKASNYQFCFLFK